MLGTVLKTIAIAATGAAFVVPLMLSSKPDYVGPAKNQAAVKLYYDQYCTTEQRDQYGRCPSGLRRSYRRSIMGGGTQGGK